VFVQNSKNVEVVKKSLVCADATPDSWRREPCPANHKWK
jgi:hypothetical protein